MEITAVILVACLSAFQPSAMCTDAFWTDVTKASLPPEFRPTPIQMAAPDAKSIEAGTYDGPLSQEVWDQYMRDIQN